MASGCCLGCCLCSFLALIPSGARSCCALTGAPRHPRWQLPGPSAHRPTCLQPLPPGMHAARRLGRSRANGSRGPGSSCCSSKPQQLLRHRPRRPCRALPSDDAPSFDEVSIPGLSVPGVTLRQHPRYGLSAFTARPFPAGAVVLSEAPLLAASPLEDAQLQRLHAAACAADPSVDADDWLRCCRMLLAFHRAGASTQQHVLQHVYSRAPPGSPLELHCRRRAHVLAQVAQTSLGVAPSASTIQSLLQAVEMNAHAVPGRSTALYAMGSKLAHTCTAPNTEFMACQGQGYHVAMHDLPAGTLLTTTYLGPAAELMGTAARRQRLWNAFGFVCGCEACQRVPDLLVALPCPFCARPGEARGADGLLPGPIALGRQQPKGLLRLWGAPPEPEQVPLSRGVWRCDACGGAVEDQDALLFPGHAYLQDLATPPGGEQPDGSAASGVPAGLRRLQDLLAAMVLEMDRQLKEDPACAEYEEALRVLAAVGWSVGSNHWLFHYALLLQSRMLLAELAGVAAELGAPGRGASAQQLSVVQGALGELQDNWGATWAWLQRQGRQDAGRVLMPHAVALAVNLLRMAPALAPVWQQQPALLTQAQRLVAAMLDAAQPHVVGVYGTWRLPEEHPVSADYRMARQLLGLLSAALPGQQPGQVASLLRAAQTAGLLGQLQQMKGKL